MLASFVLIDKSLILCQILIALLTPQILFPIGVPIKKDGREKRNFP
jgi:hypothetical protein